MQDKSRDSTLISVSLVVRPCGMLSGRAQIGETLRKLRGKTPRVELASVSGISAIAIQQIEEGRSKNPTIETLMALCGALQVSPFDFLREAYPDLAKEDRIIVREPGTVSTNDIVLLVEGFGRVSSAKRALALVLLGRGRTEDQLKHFRDHGCRLSLDAVSTLSQLLGEIEKLVANDHSETP